MDPRYTTLAHSQKKSLKPVKGKPIEFTKSGDFPPKKSCIDDRHVHVVLLFFSFFFYIDRPRGPILDPIYFFDCKVVSPGVGLGVKKNVFLI